MSRPFYLTTPLYYVNAQPHLGHAYTTVVADCLARARRQRGEQVFLLTGTDEHGQKIAQAAKAQGVSAQDFVEAGSKAFRELWGRLNLSYDDFIRTTEERHRRTVQAALEKLKPQLILGTYAFWYCVPCETQWGLSEVKASEPKCPGCGRPVSKVEEEDYFLPLERHRAWLQSHIEAHPGFIQPAVRRNEVLGMLQKPLPDLCVTRPKDRVPWGIPVPFSGGHVTYVWFDALLNYISALGWPEGQRYRLFWEGAGAVHLIGKDILRHHALYWPIILHALELPPPRTVFAHGWWMVQGEKMSKSKGNIVDPRTAIGDYGLDPFRHFLLSEVPFGEDGVFSEEALVKRINSDLANDLGNLVYRTLTMLEKHAAGKVPSARPDPEWSRTARETQAQVSAHLEALAPDRAVRALWGLVGRANRSVEEAAPWTLAREGKRQALDAFLYQLAERVRVIALLLFPFLPETAASIWRQMGFDGPVEAERLPEALERPIPPGQAVRKGKPLFPRVEYK